jgi:hypothetical protein
MSLTEDQIARFARQILVKPVGGRGQEQLCAATARVDGSTIAARYLEAGGTQRGDGGWLAVGREGFAWSLGCNDCRAQGLTPTEDVERGATAALAFQRAVLGLAAPQGGEALVRCARHA